MSMMDTRTDPSLQGGHEGMSPISHCETPPDRFGSPSTCRKPARPTSGEPFEAILMTLTRQKETFRQERKKEEEKQTRLKSLGALGRRARSEPQLAATSAAASSSSASPAATRQLTSLMHGSAAYSFGKPRHTYSTFGRQVLEPRDMEYVKPNGGVIVPGAGAYEHLHPDGKGLPETDGHTGGWAWRDHNTFLKALAEHQDSASPEFFDRAIFLLPHKTRAALTDHLRWLVEFRKTESKKHRLVLKWSEERHKQEHSQDKRQQWLERKEQRMYLEQADAEDERQGRRDREIHYAPIQIAENGDVIEKNMRGHPSYQRTGVYRFGREIRDPTIRRMTHLSHVRSTSALDVPGPGSYLGTQEKLNILPSSSSWTMRQKMPAQKVDEPSRSGPGYDGPLDAGHRLQREIKAIQGSRPEWTVPKAPQRQPLYQKVATEDLGPGMYEHATALHTQFPR